MCIRFMLFLLIWSAKENHQIHLILFNHRCHLLFAAHMSRMKFMDVQIRSLLNQTPGCPGGIKLMLAEDSSVCNTKILKQFFLRFVCDEANVHFFLLPNIFCFANLRLIPDPYQYTD